MKFMHAKVTDERILSSKKHIFEPKLDGYRSICLKNSKLKFISRNNLDITDEFPEFDFTNNIKAKSCILDGEIVIYDKRGNPSFSLIQQRKRHNLEATYVIFDILSLNGEDLKNKKLMERKDILEKIIQKGKNIQLIFYTSDGKKLFSEVKKRHLEGIIAKLIDSRYISGRSSSWLKLKLQKTIDCIIIGYTSEKRKISSLALGVYKNEKIEYLGKVGTGFDENKIKMLYSLLKDIEIKATLPKGIIPVKPKYVCEIKYLEFTNDYKLRAPVFLRLRDDKTPKECKIEQLKEVKYEKTE